MAHSEEKVVQLDHFMKLVGLVETGGQAKLVIQGGEVLLNGQVETRRKKKLHEGDEITFRGETWVVEFE